MVTRRFPNGIGYVGYKERTTELMHTVTLMPQGPNSTMVFVSTSSSLDMMNSMGASKPPAGLPHPPNATNTTVIAEGPRGLDERWELPLATVLPADEGRLSGVVEVRRESTGTSRGTTRSQTSSAVLSTQR